MKKIVYFSLFFLSLYSFAQSSSDAVVKGRLFTVDERVRLQIAYDEKIPELNLNDDQLYRYSTIIDNNVYYMIDYNKKNDKTKEELDKYINKRIIIQNKELQKLLSPEQYKKHLEIYQTIILTPIRNRINSM